MIEDPYGIKIHNVQKTGWEYVVQVMPPHCCMAKFGLYVGKSINSTQYHRKKYFQIYYTTMERIYEHTFRRVGLHPSCVTLDKKMFQYLDLKKLKRLK